MPSGSKRTSGRKKGVLIVLEGIDGTGKTTQAKLLVKRLKAQGVPCVFSHEPGGTAGAEKLRSLLLYPPRGGWGETAEVLLFLAARSEHMEHKVQPALQEGKVVVLDRFSDSTMAYQGFGRGLKPAERANLAPLLAQAAGGVRPDLTIVLDLPARTAMKRVQKRKDKKTEFEKRGEAWLERVRKGFLWIAREKQEKKRGATYRARRYRVVDARLAPEAQADEIWQAVAPLVRGRGNIRGKKRG